MASDADARCLRPGPGHPGTTSLKRDRPLISTCEARCGEERTAPFAQHPRSPGVRPQRSPVGCHVSKRLQILEELFLLRALGWPEIAPSCPLLELPGPAGVELGRPAASVTIPTLIGSKVLRADRERRRPLGRGLEQVRQVRDRAVVQVGRGRPDAVERPGLVRRSGRAISSDHHRQREDRLDRSRSLGGDGNRAHDRADDRIRPTSSPGPRANRRNRPGDRRRQEP